MVSLERILEEGRSPAPLSLVVNKPELIYTTPGGDVQKGNQFSFITRSGEIAVLEGEDGRLYFVNTESDCFEEIPQSPPEEPSDPTYSIWYRG
jgi:hypothetical protein